MMGTDYNKSTGMTHAAIIRLLKTYKGIENLHEKIPHLFEKEIDYNKIKNYYLSEPQNKNEIVKLYKWIQPNYIDIKKEISDKYGVIWNYPNKKA